MSRKEQPLTVTVNDGLLTISVGINTLALCAETQDYNPRMKILSAKTLAEDVCKELTLENEIGATALTDLFDAAVTQAWERGSTAFSDEDIPIR